MNIKRIAYDKIIEHLRRQIRDVDDSLGSNRRRFKELEIEQTSLKRQKTELVRLINIVEGDKPKEKD